MHELAGYTAFLRWLSAYARVVTFDKRSGGAAPMDTGLTGFHDFFSDNSREWIIAIL
jgi:hypothetical protein